MMATLPSINVPDAAIPVLIPYMTDALESAGVDTSSLTPNQIGKRFIVGVLRRIYEDIKVEEAHTIALQTVENARQNAKQDANGIT